jgi:ABC-type branched-subunit amino acid transport system ATPase component
VAPSEPQRATDPAGLFGAGAWRGALEVQDLRVRFGGVIAVKDLTLRAPTGAITGLIGPNGAGKTTVFNACCGLNHPDNGRILLGDSAIGRLSPAARARRGLGRSFQRTELCDTLSVWQNVAIGRESSMAANNPLSHILSRPADTAAVRDATNRALELCGLTEIARQVAGDLSTGQRRLVELARCLAGPFRLLLLDEPSSGLDRAATNRFGEVLRVVVQERNIGVLLVEHDVSLVMDICDYIYVIDFGELIAAGTAEEVRKSPAVQAAYLGLDTVTEDSAGTTRRERSAP